MWEGPAKKHTASQYLLGGEDEVGVRGRRKEVANGPWSQMDGGMEEEEETQSDEDGGRQWEA